MASATKPAVHNFIALATAAIPALISGGKTQIVFGELPKYIAPVTLQILEVTGNQDPAEMGVNFRREETFSIICEIVTWAGDDNYLKRFDDAVTIFDDIALAVGNNPWLSTSGLNDSTAAVRYAEVGDFTIIPHADQLGQSRCSFQFHVRCSQRITSLT